MPTDRQTEALTTISSVARWLTRAYIHERERERWGVVGWEMGEGEIDKQANR